MLLTIFAAPAASVVGFVTAVVEAIESFVYAAFQAFTFHKATEKARELSEAKTLPCALSPALRIAISMLSTRLI